MPPFIVGNPPFIGAKLLRRALGHEYVEHLFRIFKDRLPGMSDFVVYWHEKARAMLEAGRVEKVGLLATQSIRGGLGRRVLERIKESGDIYMAWSDEQWILDGAAVHISFVAYDDGSESTRLLNGQPVTSINANLTAGADLTQAVRLEANARKAFIGDQKSGRFEVPGDVAAEMLGSPYHPGRPNREVVRPWANGSDLVQQHSGTWIIDFGTDMPMAAAALYQAPFEHVRNVVKPQREASGIGDDNWWLHWRPRPDMRLALDGLNRYIATPRVSKHRVFVWLSVETLLDSAAVAIASEDDFAFGVLHSRLHEAWARGMGTQLREVESGFRYTPTTTFETFPFPRPSDEQREAIAEAARELHRLREVWLNPEGALDEELERRTLTNLYNERPSWLAQAHDRLDQAVLDAYGWPADIGTDDLLARLLALNLVRASSRGR